MSISFEDAVKTLKSMFPEWDEEMLGVILESNQYHVERTIEVVLSMSGVEGSENISNGDSLNRDNDLIDIGEVEIVEKDTKPPPIEHIQEKKSKISIDVSIIDNVCSIKSIGPLQRDQV